MASASLSLQMIEGHLAVAGVPWRNPENGEQLSVERRIEILCTMAAFERAKDAELVAQRLMPLSERCKPRVKRVQEPLDEELVNP